jgi:hypothetical protein
VIEVLELLEFVTLTPVIPTDAERTEIVLSEVAGEEVTVRIRVPVPTPPQVMEQAVLLVPLHPERE